MYNCGKILDSCSCGKTIYIKTDRGCCTVHRGDETISTENGVLMSTRQLANIEYPLPSNHDL